MCGVCGENRVLCMGRMVYDAHMWRDLGDSVFIVQSVNVHCHFCGLRPLETNHRSVLSHIRSFM